MMDSRRPLRDPTLLSSPLDFPVSFYV
jgi:hypothetical protein